MRGADRENAEHREVSELIPWLANGTLEEAERVRVEEHLAACSACRDELAMCRELQASVKLTRDGAWEPPAGQLDRLLQRLPPQSEAPRERGLLERLGETWQELSRPARWAVAAPSALAAGLALVVLWQASAPGPQMYQTLTSPVPATLAEGPRLEIVFAEDATEPRLRALLLAADASIVGGPSALGVYTLELPPGASVEAVVTRLRSDPGVRLVEPLSPTRP